MAKKHDYSFRERFAFKTGTPFFHEIRKGGYVTELKAVLRGSLVVSAGTASGTALGENPGNLMQRFDIDAVSKGVYPGGKLKSLSPRSVLRRHVFDKGAFQKDLSIPAGLTGAAGTFVLNLAFHLRFALPMLARSFETALNTDAYTGLTLQMTTGSRDTQFTGNDRTFDFTSVVLDILDFREAADVPVGVVYDTDVKVPIVGANNRFPVNGELPKGESYVDLLWMAETTNQALADTIINKIDLLSGTDQFYSQISDYIKQENAEWFNDPQATQTGLYYTPIAKDGLLAGVVRDISGILDVSDPAAGSDFITVNSRRVILPQEFLPAKAA